MNYVVPAAYTLLLVRCRIHGVVVSFDCRRFFCEIKLQLIQNVWGFVSKYAHTFVSDITQEDQISYTIASNFSAHDADQSVYPSCPIHSRFCGTPAKGKEVLNHAVYALSGVVKNSFDVQCQVSVSRPSVRRCSE